MKIYPAFKKDIQYIQLISKEVWPVTFGEILSEEQIDYMMEMMYSDDSLLKQLDDGHFYVLAEIDSQHVGYMSYQLNYNSKHYTKINKLYITPSAQGRGIGRAFINYVSDLARRSDQKGLLLNVNRYNEKAMKFYKTLGFETVHHEDNDIGNGFLMEDYVMEMYI